MDAYDRLRQWPEKPPDNPLTIPAEFHRAVMKLAPDEPTHHEAFSLNVF
jgi:hypothetical protein